MRAFIDELGVRDFGTSTAEVFALLYRIDMKVDSKSLSNLDKLLNHPHYICRDPTGITTYALRQSLLPHLIQELDIVLTHIDDFLEYNIKNKPNTRGIISDMNFKMGQQQGYRVTVMIVSENHFDYLTRANFIDSFINAL